MRLEFPLVVLLVSADSLDVDDLFSIMRKRRNAVSVAAKVEHREAADEGHRCERRFQFARIAPTSGLDGVSPVPHRTGGARLASEELPNPLLGHDPHTLRFPQWEPRVNRAYPAQSAQSVSACSRTVCVAFSCLSGG